MYLTDNTQSLELNTSVTSSVSLDVVATWFNVNLNTKTESLESADYNITTVATTTIVGVPLSNTTRKIVQVLVKNKGTATTTVTLRKVASGFTREQPSIELNQNESFVYSLEDGFIVFNNKGSVKGAGSGGSSSRGLVITATGSGSYVAPLTGWYYITTQGGGGAGAGRTSVGAGGGGGAGMYVKDKHFLSAGVSYSYSVGAGGTGTTGLGGSGANTSFTGSNRTQTALGGGGAFSTNHGNGARLDGNTTNRSPALFITESIVYGANGADSSSNAPAGYCGANLGGARGSGTNSGFGGAASVCAAGPTGANSDANGNNGALGAGGSGASIDVGGGSRTGGSGGNGFIEIEYVGAV